MYDVAIIGSGFGGSATSIMLAKLGYSVVLIERGKHPRFAIGESTTPLMSKTIRYLGEAYDIPEFVAMSSYDHIQQSNLPFTHYPKELFHYFWHQQGQQKAMMDDVTREIIVRTPEIDCQMLRGEADKYLVDVAVNYGVDYRDCVCVEDIKFTNDDVKLTCKNIESDKVFSMQAKFLIDGTGFKSILSDKLNLKIPSETLDTPLNSRSIFTHFEAIDNFEAVSSATPAFIDRTPVSRDYATQHHCFNGGWFWVIPFGNGVTSVGLNLDIDVFGINDKSAEDEFWEITRRYPIVEKMLKGKKTLFPFIKTDRIQFRTRNSAGDRWAMLPASATGGDAWFSTGLAFTLICAHRIVDLLDKDVFPKNNFSASVFKHYESNMYKEWRLVTKMIDGIYKSFKHFEVFKYYCFFCFMGAETFVKRKGFVDARDSNNLLLNVGDEKFVKKFNEFYALVKKLNKQNFVSAVTVEHMKNFVQHEMKDYNYRGYGNPKFNGVHDRIKMTAMEKMATNKSNKSKGAKSAVV
ncbi:MAG: tryptophan 7-halogenase [Cellvibrionaceae bacterium]|nr:tryptophan 7-halogenase [Cellvibrionaceae bacterium]